MKVLGRLISTRTVAAAALAVALLTSACDSGPANPTLASSIHFVGNSTCKTDGAQSYIPAPPNTNGPPVGTAIDEICLQQCWLLRLLYSDKPIHRE